MNHDYAHCVDFTEDCPLECFRAQLSRDIKEHMEDFVGVPLSYSYFKWTEECPLTRDDN